MVGFDKHMIKILDVLTHDQSHLRIFPIIGPGGIGKTTLAKSIFEHHLITSRFDICIWVTISQDYSIPQTLRDLLNEQSENYDRSVAKLGESLHKKLFGKRYLIVLDDMWASEVWDDLKMHFPGEGDEGSWIMITTRLFSVGNYVGSRHVNPYLIDFLSNDESWSLLCQKLFLQDNCPHMELKEIGKEIANSCRGLPILINVIAGLLSKSDMTKEYWKFVAQNVSTLGNLEDDEEHCLTSLYLSYDNLHIHLKSCFFYMRVYPEDAMIDVSELITIWIAEGFVKLDINKSLEETAEEHIKDLIDRNLIFIRKRSIRGKVETCGIHDLLRDLCLIESTKECFKCSPKVQHKAHYYTQTCFLCSRGVRNKEPIVVHEFVHFSSLASGIFLFLCHACKKVYSDINRLKFLRVMDDGSCDLVQPSGLRYASIYVPYLQFTSPSAFHLLWNLQTLKIQAKSTWNLQIWEMPQLRHVDVNSVALADLKVKPSKESDCIVLKNLLTLKTSTNFKCTKDILARIPNVKELQLFLESDNPCDLTQLVKLESLNIHTRWKNFVLPESLRKLVLSSCPIPWEDMTIIGSLRNLEELTLDCSGKGRDWNPVEGEFRKLKGLSISSCEVANWRAESSCFPVLEWLILENLQDFEIPLDMGYIDTLRSIELYDCGLSVIESARKICEEKQENSGNENLQFHVPYA